MSENIQNWEGGAIGKWHKRWSKRYPVIWYKESQEKLEILITEVYDLRSAK